MSSNLHPDEYIDFQKYWLVFRRRWKSATAIFATVVGLSLVTVISLDKVYEAEAKLLIKVDGTAKLTGLDSGTGDIEGLTMESDPLTTEAEILSSRPIVQNLIKELDLKDDSGELIRYKDFVGSLIVKPITGTDLLEITYLDNDPERAALVVNKIVELYIEDHRINNRSETATAKEFIEQQIPKVAASVKKAEGELRNFKNKNRIASLSEETSANIDSISQISNKMDDVEAELENINARYNRLQTQLNMNWQEASAVSALSQSVGVQRVLKQLQEVNVALAQKRNYLSDNTPQIIALKEERADLKNLLDEQIAQTLGGEQRDIIKRVNILSLGDLKQEQISEFANLGLQKEGLEKQLANLKNTYSSYKQRSDALPALQEQQRELERRVKAAQSTYQTLLAKLQETRIAEQQNIGNVRVVSKADVPDKEVGPKKKLIVGGAGIAGALLGIGTAFLLDIRDNTIKNSEEIKQILPYSMSGFVPDLNLNKINKKKQLSLPDSSMSHIPPFASASISNSFIREAFNNIQINLGLLDSQITNKVIVVTSAATGEGKSFVAANLAIAQAQCGKKVLLIDGDLRCPTQHSLWNVTNNFGLNDILEQESKWQNALHGVMQNLDLITSGNKNHHPISLFNSSFMEILIASLSDSYDSVIIDTPPLVGMSDSKILGKLADGLLFITRPGVANYGSVLAAREILADKNLNVLGVVANGVNCNLEAYGSNYYYADTKYLKAGR